MSERAHAGLHHLLRASVERAPDHAAFVRGARTVSYASLVESASRWADVLRSLGTERGDRVAIVLDGDEDYLVALYGTWMAGAVAVPLCPDTRTGPLVHALAHSGAKLVVLDASNVRYLRGQAHTLPDLRAIVHRGALDAEDRTALASAHEYAPLLAHARASADVAIASTELAAILYTSGTTGRAKGVMLSHANFIANTRSITSYLALTASDRVAMVLPFYYAYGNSVLHTHLAVGGTIVHAGSTAFPAAVLAEMQRNSCTGFAGVPSTFARLLSLASFAEPALATLRYVTQAGAAMPAALVRELGQRLPRARIFVMYGQTEATARLAYVPPDRLADKLGSAGRAIPGVELTIRDRDGRELPRGASGEVVARGDNVMLGYYRDPEASARVLRPEGLYTGDIGRMDDEGFLFLEGRDSELIKSGGHRISPFEIEEALSRAPGVREAAVCGVADELLGEAIHAFVIVEDTQAITKKVLLDACFASLPHFKMPKVLYAVSELPRNAAGKLQRSRLAPEIAGEIAAGRARRL